ncbi:MAG: hypothetical protein JNM69_18470 [Archangium sp.]|nr:hypothetical protein [Archangium sp.]
MARFVVAVSSLVLVFGSILGAGCGPSVPVPDAGSPKAGGLSGTGGGTSGTGGGTSGTGGGMSGTGGGSAADAGACLQFTAPIAYTGGPGSGSYELLNDGGLGLHYTGVVTNSAPYVTVDLSVFNRNPAVAVPSPLTGTFETITNAMPAFPVSLMGTNCQMNGSGCVQTFLARRGAYNVTSATNSVDAGTFVGSITGVRYVQVDSNSLDPIPDGGCIDLNSFSFTTQWP